MSNDRYAGCTITCATHFRDEFKTCEQKRKFVEDMFLQQFLSKKSYVSSRKKLKKAEKCGKFKLKSRFLFPRRFALPDIRMHRFISR